MQLPLSLATSSQTCRQRPVVEIASEPSAVVRGPVVRAAAAGRTPRRRSNRLAARAGARCQPPQAEVVAPPLDQHGGELQRDHAVEQRQVLADQLLLQADRVRGDDDPPDGASARSGLRLGSTARMAGTR